MSTFPELREIGEHLGSRSAILDGEIVALDKEDRPNFSTLAKRLHVTSKTEVQRLTKSIPASFFAFDVFYLEGHSLMSRPYDERRAALETLKLNGETFATPPSITDSTGAKVLDISRERGLEGVVIKRRASPYLPGSRAGDWIKVKNFRTQEVVIGGWTEGKGERDGTLGALLLGVPNGDGLTYVGKVGTGFTAATPEGAPRSLETARSQDDSVLGAVESRRDGARALRSTDDRRRGPVRGVDARRPPAPTVVARAPVGQRAERGRP